MPTLFDPLALGALTLPNRILMAPLTRCRAGTSRVPNALMRTYYAQRASAGLILSEATSVAPSAIAAKGNVSLLRPVRPYPLPRALGAEEIPGIVSAFRRGAENAQA